jgi:hypothetical protein
MKNANVFVDVGLTLVDANGKLLDGARDGLEGLKEKGSRSLQEGRVEKCAVTAELLPLCT